MLISAAMHIEYCWYLEIRLPKSCENVAGNVVSDAGYHAITHKLEVTTPQSR